MARRGRRRRPSRSALALRWIGAAVLVVIALGYVHPIRAYRDARGEVESRQAETTRLARANAALERQLRQAGTLDFVEREARGLGLVRPGEQLFIVTGIDRWRQARVARTEKDPGLR